MSRHAAKDATAGWLERLGLTDRSGARLEELSHGNQQRVQLAAALVHDPELAVLDEPFSGLDPLGVESLAELLVPTAATGVAVLFSSHQLDLVEDVCQDVVVIDHGKIVLAGVVDELKAASPRRSLQITVNGDPFVPVLPGTVTSKHDGRLRVLVDASVDVEDILASARSAGGHGVQLRTTLAHGPVPGGRIGGAGRMSGGWRRLWLVARREWNQRARTTAFQLSTLISILLVVAIILVPDMSGRAMSRERTVGIVGTSSVRLPALLRFTGEQVDLAVATRRFHEDTAGRAAVRSGDISVLLVDQRRLVWRTEIDDQLQAVVASSVGVLQREDAIDELGLAPEEARELLEPPTLVSTRLEAATEERREREELAWIALLVLFLTLSVYGGFLVVGVVEEKSSRVVEVLLSRLRSTELLAGKILGIGLVGLAQLALVAAAALVALRFAENPSATTTPSTVGWIVFWFVLGYGFYSVLYATAGSLVSRQEEAQSIQFPISAILIVAYFASMEAARSPDSTATLLGSLFPPTAPMIMITRIAHGDVRWWQIVLSVALMVVTIYGLVQLAGRIYAGAVLRFGGRLRLREAWRGAET